jgi:molybdate transport system substrate-binding protein
MIAGHAARQRAFFVLLILGVFGIDGCAHERKELPRVVAVAAAADLRFAFEEIREAFRKAHPAIEVRVTYGASGNFYAQLTNRAPFDVFLSADVEFPRRLVESGLAIRDSEFSYAIGHLVLWAPVGSPIDLEKQGIRSLLDPSVTKIAIANPDHAPYGRAAVAALRKLDMYDRIKDRLVRGENVAQAGQYAQSGNAQLGIIPLSLALAPGYRDGRRWAIPGDAYPPLEQGAAILSWARDREAARLLCAFIRGREGKAILQRFGFTLPKE